MRIRRLTSMGVAVAFIAALGVVAIAPSASAETIRVQADCVTGDIDAPHPVIIASPGDTIVVDGPSCGRWSTNNALHWLFDVFPWDTSTSNTWVVKRDMPLHQYGLNIGAIRVTAVDIYTNPGQTFDLMLVGSAIPLWYQSYARATAETACISGWTPSWEMWPNGGKGGWVCVRSVPSLG